MSPRLVSTPEIVGAEFVRVNVHVRDPLHDAVAEDAVELLVKRGRGPHEVMGEVGPPEVAEVDRPELLP